MDLDNFFLKLFCAVQIRINYLWNLPNLYFNSGFTETLGFHFFPSLYDNCLKLRSKSAGEDDNSQHNLGLGIVVPDSKPDLKSRNKEMFTFMKSQWDRVFMIWAVFYVP